MSDHEEKITATPESNVALSPDEATDAAISAADETTTSEINTLPTAEEAEKTAETDDAAEAASVDEAGPSAAAITPPTNKRHPLGWIFDFVEILTFALCASLLVFTFGWRLCQVDGDSMNRTLRDQEMLVVTSLAKPEAGDIIVFHNISKDTRYTKPLVKRVIATEGQTVRIDYEKQTVEVDGVVLDEPYVALLGYGGNGTYADLGYMIPYGNHHMITTETGVIFEAVVPDGHYFVMGDNRNHSADSRDSAIGFVDERQVLGTLACRISPFATADELND